MGDPKVELTVSFVDSEYLLAGGNRSERLAFATTLRARFGAKVRPDWGGYRLPVEAGAEMLRSLPVETVWTAAARSVAEERLRLEEGNAAAVARLLPGFAAVPDLSHLGLLLPLDRHQALAANAIADPNSLGLALFDEQGTGKTFSTLAGFALLRSQGAIDRMLIVAPKSVLPAWQSDAARLIGPELEITVLTGNADRRRGAIRRRHDVMVSSYESTAAELSALLRHLLATKARYLLVVDESYFVKNPSTRRARALAELRRVCERAVVLSGTPAPNRAWDLVNQVNLADGGVAFAGASKPSDPDEERSQVATRLGSAAILRRLKTDVLPDLPSQSHREIQVELAPEQRSLYERAARDLLLDVRGVNDKEFLRDLRAYLARRNTLLQLCSHPGAIVPDYQETPAKFIALDDLVHDLVEVRREKVVIWSWFRYSLDVIASRYAHHGLVRIDGSVPSLDARSAAVDRFQRDPDVRVFVGNAAAAGAGLTLTAARVAIYESFSNQAAHYMQSLDRIHRRGQRRDVTYAVLISSRTVEAAEFERLVAKQLQARDLLGDDRPGRPARAMFAAELEEGLESEVAR